MEQILVPIDFSPDSEKALLVAAKEAKLRDAKVVLLHVIENIAAQDLELYPAIITEDDSGREIRAKERLEQIATRLFAGIDCQIMLRRSMLSVYTEIVAVESELPISLVVISAHSRNFFEKLFLESTSNKVVNASKCPVLVVPV